MLILTDRAKDGHAVHDYLTRSGRSHIVALHRPPAQPIIHPIIVCDVDVANDMSTQLLRDALTQHRVDAAIPILFLTRDNGHRTTATALSLGATELIDGKSPLPLIQAAAQRLIYDYENKSKGATRDLGATRAYAGDAKSALAACFDAAQRNAAAPMAELNEGARLVLVAVKKADIRAWLDVVWEFDDLTYQHCLLVAGLVAAFSLKLGVTSANQLLLSQAALIHDVGKARLPAAVLNKPGALTSSEMALMRTHAAIGHAMLAGQRGVSPVVLDVIRHHHEYLDGSGYPDGLKGRQVSDFARLVTICDIYAALIERRAYKTPMPAQQALATLQRMGAKLDQSLLKKFATLATEGG